MMFRAASAVLCRRVTLGRPFIAIRPQSGAASDASDAILSGDQALSRTPADSRIDLKTPAPDAIRCPHSGCHLRPR